MRRRWSAKKQEQEKENAMTARSALKTRSRPSPRRLAPARLARTSPSRTARLGRPRGRTIHTPGLDRDPPDADNYGVIWLDCAGQPVADALESLMRLVEELDGSLNVLDRAPTHVIALVHLPRESFARFRGALALAGGSFIGEGSEDQVADTVFILSQASGGSAEGR
jgi:hypothetical protein